MQPSETIKYALNWGAILGLLPFNTSTTTEIMFKRNKIYSIAVTFLLISLGIFSIQGRSYFISSNTFLTTVGTNCLVFSHTYLCSGASQLNGTNFQKFFSHFDKIDLELAHLGKSVLKWKHFKTFFVSINAFIILLVVSEFAHWFFGIREYQYVYFLEDLLHTYIDTFLIIFEVLILLMLKERIIIMHEIIANENKNASNIDVILKIQCLLSDLSDMFNTIFGTPIAMTLVHVITTLLATIATFVTAENNLKTGIVLSVIFWMIYIAIHGIVIATMCEKVSAEGKRTVSVAYRALCLHAGNPVSREKHFILAQQATARCPTFSAAGFFNVDFSMLFTFINLITTYVIVIIQFYQSSKYS